MKSIWFRCGAVLATVLLITNTILCCILLLNTSSTTQDKVESLTTNRACGQCLDLAYEGENADFSFIYCKENLKRFEITRENGDTEFTYSSDIPAISSDETLVSVRKYDDIDSTAFQRGYTEDWLDIKRKADYNESAILFVIIFSLCAFCSLIGCIGIYFFAKQQPEPVAAWVPVWGSSWLLILMNFFVWMTTIIVLIGVEVQQPQMFGETECLVIPVGYPFYRTILVLDAILFVVGVWMILLGCVGNVKTSDGDSGPNVVRTGCQLVSMLVCAGLWVVLTVMGWVVLDTVHFNTKYNNWLIGLGVACGVVCCVVCVWVPACMKVQNEDGETGLTGPCDILSHPIKVCSL